MFKNYVVAAVRNLFRDRAYAAINIFGLALGFAATILIGLFVLDELTYDRAYPRAGRIFRLQMEIKGATKLGVADARFAPALELDFPEVEFATRLSSGVGYMKHKDVEIWADFRRADPSFFRMFPPKVVAGDPNTALQRPDMLVVTRRFARELFGREDVLGEAVELRNPRTLHVGAVIEDLPSNTHFAFDAVTSTTSDEQGRSGNPYTYVLLRPGADVREVQSRLPDFVRRHVSETVGNQPLWKIIELRLVALRDIHFLPPGVSDMKAPSDRRTVSALVVIGLLIVLVASSNFISMMTARSARRAIEVGVRKAVGATRRQIVVQFLGECLFYAGLALGIAMIAVEAALPGFNGFLQRDIAFDYIREPMLGATIAAAWLAVSLAAAAYPALILSMFRPVTVLKGVLSLPGGPGRLRNASVILQFGVLVALMVATITIHRQTRFAMAEQLRVPGDQTYVMRVPCVADFGFRSVFRDVARQIPGVRQAACASDTALQTDRGGAVFDLQDGSSPNLNPGHIDTGFFDLFAIKPLAGRVFDDRHGEDSIAVDTAATKNPSIILNESGARAVGYANPRDALGKTLSWHRLVASNNGVTPLEAQPSQVVGIVPDFTIGSVRDAVAPTVYYVQPQASFVLVLRLDGRRIPETMRSLEVEWKKAAAGGPLIGQFMSQIVNERYADIQRQTKLFAAFSAVAIIVASLGIFGLAVYTAERRTREIGLRKVMGASRADILRFIGWQFAQPVLLANLLAWPFAWFFMRRWLDGFAYHVNLGATAFLGATAIAVLLALITVSGHALLVARARPAEALRYE